MTGRGGGSIRDKVVIKAGSRVVNHNKSWSNLTNEIGQQDRFEVCSTTGEKLGLLRVDSTILLAKDSQGIENSEAESIDSQVWLSEKSQRLLVR